MFSNTIALDYQKNFSLKLKVRQVSGANDNPFGLLFNGKDSDNLYIFSVTNEGMAEVIRYKDGEKYALVDEWEVGGVNAQGAWNVLEIRKVNDAHGLFS